MKRLLAKSAWPDPDAPGEAATLRGHTAMVVKAAQSLLTFRLNDVAAAMRLDVDETIRLGRIVLVAAFMHDLGKCSDHFQLMVRKKRREPQLIRHEAATLWLTWPGQPLADWLDKAFEERPTARSDYLLACMAGAGHHRKFTEKAIAKKDAGAGSTLTLLCGHDDFRETLEFGARRLGLDEPPSLQDIRLEGTYTEPIGDWLEDRNEDLEDDNEHTERDWLILAAAKALLIAADVVGSALPKAGEKPTWVSDQLSGGIRSGVFDDVVALRLGGDSLRLFQEKIRDSAAPVTLVKAGCGSGKTIGAYAWAAQQHPERQLWLTYPTTGTTTEGYRDYIVDANVTGRLEHGRAEVDLEMLGLQDDEAGAWRSLDRLDALRNWATESVTCTVDTVLGLMQLQRRGTYAFPALVCSAIVFDEIHSYDDSLFSALLGFLRTFPGVPSLLMTASLPTERLRELEECMQQVHGRGLEIIAGPTDLEELKRYEYDAEESNLASAQEACLAALERDEKVLWVSNTVGRAQEAWKSMKEKLPAAAKAVLYHSRFKYEDRVDRHRVAIAAFKIDGPVALFATQVAEMSLDLSADLLITDRAPVPSMIQRLGRLNRRATPANPTAPKRFLVLRAPSPLPYKEEALRLTDEWLKALATVAGGVSQKDLVKHWQQKPNAAGDDDLPTRWCELVDGHFKSEVKPLRDGTPGLSVILQADLKDVARKKKRVVKVSLPMNLPPKAMRWQDWDRVAHHPVPPAECITYDKERGGEWMKQK